MYSDGGRSIVLSSICGQRGWPIRHEIVAVPVPRRGWFKSIDRSFPSSRPRMYRSLVCWRERRMARRPPECLCSAATTRSSPPSSARSRSSAVSGLPTPPESSSSCIERKATSPPRKTRILSVLCIMGKISVDRFLGVRRQ